MYNISKGGSKMLIYLKDQTFFLDNSGDLFQLINGEYKLINKALRLVLS